MEYELMIELKNYILEIRWLIEEMYSLIEENKCLMLLNDVERCCFMMLI